jgi:hypothetical protein
MHFLRAGSIHESTGFGRFKPGERGAHRAGENAQDRAQAQHAVEQNGGRGALDQRLDDSDFMGGAVRRSLWSVGDFSAQGELLKCLSNLRVELGSGVGLNLIHRSFPGHRHAMCAGTNQRVIAIRNRNDA